MEKTPRVQEDWASAWNGVDPEDEFRPLARSPRRQKRTPGQIDARSHSSAPQPASDPRSQTVELPSNKCDVAVSCPHSILDKKLECCADQLNPPRKTGSDRPTVRTTRMSQNGYQTCDGSNRTGHFRSY